MADLVCLKMDKHSQGADDEDSYRSPPVQRQGRSTQSREKTAVKGYFAAIQLKKPTVMMKGTRQKTKCTAF